MNTCSFLSRPRNNTNLVHSLATEFHTGGGGRREGGMDTKIINYNRRYRAYPRLTCLLCTWLYLNNAGGGRSPWTRQAAQSLSFSLFVPRRSKCRCPLMLRSESSRRPLSNPPPSPNTPQAPHFPSLNHSGRRAGRTLSRVRQVQYEHDEMSISLGNTLQWLKG